MIVKLSWVLMVEIAAAVIGTAALGGGGLMTYGAVGKSARVFGPSVYRGARLRRVLALTFDDGPSESTPRLLDLLDRHSTRATFFMCGQNARRYPAITRAVVAAGHEIGNHTDSHPNLLFRSPRFIDREITMAQETLCSITGLAPRLFRAPFGVRWYGLRRVQESLGLMGVMWTVIGQDWKWPAESISQLVLDRTVTGGIVCLHDGYKTQPSPDITATLAAVALLIPQLKDRGYEFATTSQTLSFGRSYEDFAS
jgi:peptidoglycan/xylan/chitin deacetylase (PgdA/CDA1 family)